MARIHENNPVRFEQVSAEFSTWEELLAIEWVAKYAKSPDFAGYKVLTTCAPYLMATYQNGNEWCIGEIEGEWQPSR